MAGKASTIDGIRGAIYVANPHLDRGRDDRAVSRLAMVYKLTAAVHAKLDGMVNAPFVQSGSKSAIMDEYHKLYADALRLEQELGITPAARRRHGIGSGTSPAARGLEGAKA